MQWRKYVQRLGVEVLAFFLVFGIVVFVVTGRDSIADSVYTAAVGAIFYGVVTFILRERSLSRQRDSR